MVRIHAAALVLALVAAGCSDPGTFQCVSCDANSDCNKGTSCTNGYCVAPGEDPSRCPARTVSASASASSASGGASASSASSSSSSGTSGSSTSSSSSSGSSASSSSSSGSSASSASSSSSSGSSASSASSSSSSGSSAASSSGGGSSGSAGSSGTTGGEHTCQNASSLPLGVTVVGDTLDSQNNDQGPCGSNDDVGPDEVFAFDPPSTAMFAVGVDWLGPDGGPTGATPHVYAFTDCPAAQQCLLYDDVGTDRGLPLDQGVTAYIAVDSVDGGGPFALSVGYPSPNGHCASPELLSLAADGGAESFSSSLYGSSDSTAPLCSPANGIDATFELDAPSAQRYRFTVTPDVRLDVTLAGGTSCGSYDTCVETGGFGAAEVLDTPALNAGQPYFLLVDGVSNARGNFTVQVEGLGP